MMKILSDNIRLLLLLVLLGTGIISCSEDMEEVNDDAQVTFKATLQDDLLTRSFGKGLSVDKLVIGVFDLNDNGEYVEITERHYADIINGKIENVTLSLAKSETYHFIFWAYNSDSQVYDIEDEGSKLTEIKMKHDIIGFTQAENADAFFATVKDFAVTGSKTVPVELIRPLAQINVGTSGTATTTKLTVYGTADTFHPFTETLSGEANLTWSFTDTTTETFSVWIDEKEYTYNYLALGYLFAPLGKDTEAAKKACLLKLTDTNNDIPFQDVELHANRRSNIVGSFTK